MPLQTNDAWRRSSKRRAMRVCPKRFGSEHFVAGTHWNVAMISTDDS